MEQDVVGNEWADKLANLFMRLGDNQDSKERQRKINAAAFKLLAGIEERPTGEDWFKAGFQLSSEPENLPLQSKKSLNFRQG